MQPILGYFGAIFGLYQPPGPPFGSRPPFLHILDPPLLYYMLCKLEWQIFCDTENRKITEFDYKRKNTELWAILCESHTPSVLHVGWIYHGGCTYFIWKYPVEWFIWTFDLGEGHLKKWYGYVRRSKIPFSSLFRHSLEPQLQHDSVL